MFSQPRNVLTAVFLVGASFSVILAANYAPLNCLLDYGKTYQDKQYNNRQYVEKLNPNIRVPKRWFWHFYALSFIMNVVFLAISGLSWRRTLLLAQASRRLIEQLKMFEQSDASMHWSHYLVGLLFYATQAIAGPWPGPEHPKFAVPLFFLASFRQYKDHKVLAMTQKYNFPEFFFENTACPHYCMEILIYLSFLLLNPRYNIAWLTLAWTCISLGVAANKTQKFYQTRQSGTRPLNKKAEFCLIPGVY